METGVITSFLLAVSKARQVRPPASGLVHLVGRVVGCYFEEIVSGTFESCTNICNVMINTSYYISNNVLTLCDF